jgi:hypothetical protein
MAPLTASVAPDPTYQVTWGNLRVRALELAIQFTGSAENYRAKDVVTNAEEFLKFLVDTK